MYTTFVPRAFRKDEDINMSGQLPFSHSSSHLRNPSLQLASITTSRPASLAAHSHNDSGLSIRKPEAVMRLSPIPDDPQESRDGDDDYSSYLRQSQIDALGTFPIPPDQRPLTRPHAYHSRRASSPNRHSRSGSFSRSRSYSMSNNYFPGRPQSSSTTATYSTEISAQLPSNSRAPASSWLAIP